MNHTFLALQTSLLIAMEMLSGLAEEVERFDTKRGKALVQQALQPHALAVTRALQEVLLVLLPRCQQQAVSRTAAAALRCLLAWLRLGPYVDGGAPGTLLTPGEIRSVAPLLLPALVAALGSGALCERRSITL